MTNEELVTSLRQLADWYEQHPSLPVPYELQQPMFVFLYGMNEEEVRATFQEIGSFKKVFNEPSEGDFEGRKTIGNFVLRFHTKREMVCERKVVGKRIVPQVVVPARPEEVIAEHEEEIVEWDCHPILASTEAL